MANENKTAKEYVQKGYLIAHLANCGIQTSNYDEWERLCECIHEAKPADVVDRNECSKCVLYPFKQLREQIETNMVEAIPCKDCFYAKPYNKKWRLPINENLLWCEHYNEEKEPNWFCADAIERTVKK